MDSRITIPDEIQASPNDVVVFVGAGISRILKYPSWHDLSSLLMDSLIAKGNMGFSKKKLINLINDPRQKLSIAYEIAKNDPELDEVQLFNEIFTKADEKCKKSDKKQILDYIKKIGSAFITTNYDRLLDFEGAENVHDPEKFEVSFLKNKNTIHLHGSIENQENMLITTGHYLKRYQMDNVQEFLQNLFKEKIVLFIGYGMAEYEVLEYALFKGDASKGSEIRRFVIQGYYDFEATIEDYWKKYYFETYGVKLLTFSLDRAEYDIQVDILKEWAEKLNPTPTEISSGENTTEVIS